MDQGTARDDAAQILERVLEDRRRILGDEHPDTLTSMDTLAFHFRDAPCAPQYTSSGPIVN